MFSGINGLLALKDIASHKGWKLTANEHFDPVSNFSALDVSPQLEAIRKTRTRIVVLNTMARYTVVILTQASRMGMLKEWVWIVTDGSTSMVSFALLNRVTFDVSPQLEAIRKTRARIVVLNTMARYTVVILTNGNAKGMGLDCDRWIDKYSTF